jgi:hypothetical protein
VRTVPPSTLAASVSASFGFVLLLASSSQHLLGILIGSLAVLIAAMFYCVSLVLRSVEMNRTAIERKSRDDDASFDAGFEAGHLKGYAEGRRAGRPTSVVDLVERSSLANGG